MDTKVICGVAMTMMAAGAIANAASPYGAVEFRWRERGLGVLPYLFGSQVAVVPVSATPLTGAAANEVTNPTLTTDARYHLILEARVTRAAGNTDLGGLSGMAFNLVSSDTRAQGNFAANNNPGTNAWMENRNAASTTAVTYDTVGAYTARPSGTSVLPGTDGNRDRGLFGPFRRVADLGGKNQPAIGVQNLSTVGPLANYSTLENITIGASVDPLTDRLDTDGDDEPDTDGPYVGRYDFYGLDTWVPVFYAVYNLTDLSGRSSVTIEAQIAGVTSSDSGIRGFRGVNNAHGLDSWQLDNGGLPSFRLIPSPAASLACLMFLSGAVVRRNRLP